VAERISMSKLQEKMLDLSVSEEELQNYLTILPEQSGPFAPALAPNPEAVVLQGPLDEAEVEASTFLDAFLDLAQQRRRLQFEASRVKRPQLPLLFAEGDSWFQFPVFLKELIDELSSDHTIYCISRAGDTIQNMVYDNPDYLDVLDDLINDRHLKVKGFLFSGAGNDVIGNGNGNSPVLTEILRPYTPGESAEWHVATSRCDEVLDYIAQAYRKIFQEVESRFPFAMHPNLPIYLHAYDYVRVRGLEPGGDPNRPLWASDWTSGPLRDKGFTDNDFGSKVIAALLDRLNDTTEAVCQDEDRGVYVNLRGSVGDANWIDELHATSEGFARAAARFRTFLL
jgi:hypothetical protein